MVHSNRQNISWLPLPGFRDCDNDQAGPWSSHLNAAASNTSSDFTAAISTRDSRGAMVLSSIMVEWQCKSHIHTGGFFTICFASPYLVNEKIGAFHCYKKHSECDRQSLGSEDTEAEQEQNVHSGYAADILPWTKSWSNINLESLGFNWSNINLESFGLRGSDSWSLPLHFKNSCQKRKCPCACTSAGRHKMQDLGNVDPGQNGTIASPLQVRNSMS